MKSKHKPAFVKTRNGLFHYFLLKERLAPASPPDFAPAACAGGLFYCFILAVLGWNTFIGLIMLTCIFAFAGGIMAFEFGWQMVLYGTSFTGSYIFMRSCTLIFSARWAGFPNEHEIYAKLQDGEKVSDEFIAWQFWVYIAVLVIVFFGTAGY